MWHGPLRTNTPPTRVNDDLILTGRYQEILNQHLPLFHGKSYQHSSISGGSNDMSTRFSVRFLDQCFVYLITETVAEYPYTYFTEKTWKAMVSKTPFMIVGAAGSLKQLQEFGFKTFSQWWNEDYDCLPTVAERIEAIVQELKKLSTLAPTELNHMRKEIESVVVHNYNHLTSFIAEDLDNIQKNL